MLTSGALQVHFAVLHTRVFPCKHVVPWRVPSLTTTSERVGISRCPKGPVPAPSVLAATPSLRPPVLGSGRARASATTRARSRRSATAPPPPPIRALALFAVRSHRDGPPSRGSAQGSRKGVEPVQRRREPSVPLPPSVPSARGRFPGRPLPGWGEERRSAPEGPPDVAGRSQAGLPRSPALRSAPRGVAEAPAASRASQPRGLKPAAPRRQQQQQQHEPDPPRRHRGPRALGLPTGWGQGLRPAAHHLPGKKGSHPPTPSKLRLVNTRSPGERKARAGWDRMRGLLGIGRTLSRLPLSRRGS